MISTFEKFLLFWGGCIACWKTAWGFRLAFAPGAPVRTGKDPAVHSSVAQSNLRKIRPVFNATSRRVLGASSASPIRQGLGQSPTTCSARSGRAPRLPLRCTPPTGASSTPGLMLISLSLKKLASYCRQAKANPAGFLSPTGDFPAAVHATDSTHSPSSKYNPFNMGCGSSTTAPAPSSRSPGEDATAAFVRGLELRNWLARIG